MLTLLTAEELDRLSDWAYGLAMSAEHASYPTYQDGIKTQTEFLRRARAGLTRPCEEVLCFTHAGRLCGWIHWYWQREERYASTCSFLVEDHAETALAELCERVEAVCPDAMLDIGLDGENLAAMAACQGKGFALLDSSVNHTFLFTEAPPCAMPTDVAPLAEADWPDFCRLHDDPDMYWTTERIRASGDIWRNYICRRNGRVLGALSCQTGDWPEIFSVDLAEKRFDAEVYRDLLAACLRDAWASGAKHLTYFEEQAEALPILEALGFIRVGRYMAYRKQLGSKEE